MSSAPLILFDGVCAVCDAGMTFLLDVAPGSFRYAPLQGETAAAVRARHAAQWSDDLDSIVWVDVVDGVEIVRFHSDAILAIAARLPRPWRWLAWMSWVPRPIRDVAYRGFASVRYRVFGTKDACRIPTEAEAASFLP
jgi:predicted DCC family thiol-disulfide oxidoreductase YuxK